MVAPLDPLRGPSGTPQTGGPRPASGRSGAFEIEFQRLLKGGESAFAAQGKPDTGPVPLPEDLTASLEGVSESLKRANAYINSARAYFKGPPSTPPPDSSLDSRG